MSGLAAIEGELNGAVQEYLECIGLDGTLEKFAEECSLKGKPIANFSKKSKSGQKTNVILNEMTQLFVSGQRKEFFRRWLQNVPSTLLNEDIATQKLEFELNMHFAIYPLRNKNSRDAKANYEESMNHFKSYIESRGRVLSQTTEFLPFFALPYAPNPQGNPGYQQLFSDHWTNELESKLQQYLTNALRNNKQSRLVDAYSSFITKDSVHHVHEQLVDSQKQTMLYMKKFNKVQTDYYNLLGIAADLIDSLETTIVGKPVSPEYLQDVYNRLFNSANMKKSIDFSRPGTASEYIRQSLAYQKTTIMEKEKIGFGPLDYTKIKQDLCSSTVNERRKLIILQALRWRLTKSIPTERDKNLEAFITHDMLSLRSDMNNQRYDIIGLIKSDSEALRQYMARLLNTFASLNKGRTYLASSPGLIRIIHGILRNENGDTMCKQNLLAALQKLSLRRDLQLLMIDDNVISWLIELLADTEVLSDYSLEYAVALLMNLCLRTSGKHKCALDYKRTLKVLSDLLGNSNHEIRPYVNGALYSVLTIPSIREHARVMNLEEILKAYLNEGSTEMNTQIQFIINQINSVDKQTLNESDNEEDDEDEEDQDAIEADLDKAELVKSANTNELIGENLLMTDYAQQQNDAISKSNKRKSGKSGTNQDIIYDSIVLSRPTTPYQLRQSMTRQQISVNLDETELTIKSSEIAKPSRPDILRLDPIPKSNSSSQISAKGQSPSVQKKLTSAQTTLTTSQNMRKDISQKSSSKFSPSGERAQSLDKKPPSISTTVPTHSKTLASSTTANLKQSGKLQSTEKPHLVKMTSLNQETEAEQFFKSKSRRGSEQSNQYKKSDIITVSALSTNKNSTEASILPAHSFIPKYSTSEPRPSSANSSRSRNSSSSGTPNMSDYNSIKK